MATNPLAALPDEARFTLDWATFSDHPIFDYVGDIADFSLSLQFPRFLSWPTLKDMAAYQDVLYESVYAVLEQAKFFSFEQLVRVQQSSSVGVAYKDPDFGFSVELTQDSELNLRRDGSSLELFFGWYDRVMSQMTDIVNAVRAQLGAEASRPESRKNIEPVRGLYRFRFIFHDFKRQNRRGSVKNAEVLQKTLTHIPGTTGELVELGPNEIPDLGRIDLKVSRVHDSPSGPVREVYDIEAPGNRNFGSLWLMCSYIGETPSDTGEKRGIPDFREFIARHDYPLFEFVRQRALVSFLSDLTEGLSFRSTPGRLP